MSAYAHAKAVFLTALAEQGMAQHLSRGVLVGLSGGKDSVLLLSLFASYAKENGIPFSALHLHHGIRKDTADADAKFCTSLCERLGVPLRTVYADVPALAAESREGLEQTARRVRYEAFCTECASRGYGAVMTAHTASDLAESVLLSILRGGGTRALCGIPPVRREGDILVLRPLLGLYKEEVLAALAERDLPFCHDETNDDVRYRRNLVRHTLLPALRAITSAPEQALVRLAKNARGDEDYLEAAALEALARAEENGRLSAMVLRALHPAILHRVLRAFYEKHLADAPLPERVHTEALLDCLKEGGDFMLSFPGGITIRAEREWLTISTEQAPALSATKITEGANLLSDGSLFFLLPKTTSALPEIVYTLSTQRRLSSATIIGELFVRAKRDGDAYSYGGMTHKLKKLYSDRKLSCTQKRHLPVLCDEKGILWVPSFGVRDDGVKNGNAPYALYLARERVSDDVYQDLLKTLFSK